MKGLRYELHTYENPEYPLTFHYDHLQKGDNSISPHWHMNIELLYIQNGILKVTLEHEVLYAKRGEIVVINSNSVHSIESETDEVYYFCLILDYNFCNSLGFDTLNNRYQPVTNDLEMKNIYQLIVNEGTLQKQFYKKAIRALCHTMLILLHRNIIIDSRESASNYIDHDNVEIVKNIIEYIRVNYAESFTLDDLARHVAISKYHMCRIFKDVTYVTINQFITQVRLEQAQILLNDESENITDIALECGFKSLSYFTKTYKKHYGYPPSQAKNQVSRISNQIHELNSTVSVESSTVSKVVIEKYV